MNYSDKLKDPRWQKKRLEVFSRDSFSCTECKNDKDTLHVHHKQYINGRQPWEYELQDLDTLCETCHQKEHDLIPDKETARKMEHWLLYRETEPVALINERVKYLQDQLLKNPDWDLEQEILKNIMFLNNQRKELIAA